LLLYTYFLLHPAIATTIINSNDRNFLDIFAIDYCGYWGGVNFLVFWGEKKRENITLKTISIGD